MLRRVSSEPPGSEALAASRHKKSSASAERDWSSPGLLLGISAALAVVAAISALHRSPPALVRGVASASPSASITPARCPTGTLEDHGVCIPVPAPESRPMDRERIEKHPGRPSDFHGYSLPFADDVDFQIDPTSGGVGFVMSSAHDVVVPALERPVGPATIIALARSKPGYVTLLVETGLVEARPVGASPTPRAARTHHYVVRLDHLRAIPPELEVLQRVEVGQKLGRSAVAEETGQTRVELEIRRIKPAGPEGQELLDLGDELLDPQRSTEVDPRNVLVLHQTDDAQ